MHTNILPVYDSFNYRTWTEKVGDMYGVPIFSFVLPAVNWVWTDWNIDHRPVISQIFSWIQDFV